jgi:hypothetical protein
LRFHSSTAFANPQYFNNIVHHFIAMMKNEWKFDDHDEAIDLSHNNGTRHQNHNVAGHHFHP